MDGEAIESRRQNHYGDTIIESRSQAHLGDGSHDVNIHGGLHLHFEAPRQYNAISVSSYAIRLLQLYHELPVLCRNISCRDEPVKRDDIGGLNELIKRIRSVTSQVSSCSNASYDSNDRSLSEKALHKSIDSLSTDAQNIYEILERITADMFHLLYGMDVGIQYLFKELSAEDEADIERFLAQERRKMATLRSNEQKQSTSKRTLMVEKILQRKWNTFLQFWEREKIPTKLQTLQTYRKELDAKLNAVINGSACDVGPLQPMENVVEVLSISKLIGSGIQNTAAVLTRESGEISTLTPLKVTQDRSEVYTDSDLIRHHLQVRMALRFVEEHDRQSEIDIAHSKTFQWVFDEVAGTNSSDFPTWLRSGSGCYWINGKAGSGKSTLMKYISRHSSLIRCLNTWAGARQLIVCSFFFWHAGSHMQKSHEGVLRSLLRQVIEKRPSLTPILFPRLSSRLLHRDDKQYLDIKKPELQEAVSLLTAHMPQDLALFLLIDGVDEYSGDHINFCKFLLRISEHASVKILVSSRPLPACHQVFARCPHIRLQDLTAPDIRAYVDEELINDDLFLELDRLETGFAQDVRKALTEKASGVFLWIVLVVRRLQEGIGNYDDRSTLMAIIDELPSDLEKLYDHLFGQMSKRYQQEGSLLLQYLVHAREVQVISLTALQLFITLQSCDNVNLSNKDCIYDEHRENLQIKSIDGKLRSRTCGLIEVRYVGPRGKLRDPKVDFLHRTVFDYLQDSQVWNKVLDLNKVSPRQKDRVLLRALVDVFRLRMLSGETFDYDDQKPMTDLFAACLKYCYRLSCSGDSFYVDHLSLAIDALLSGEYFTLDTQAYSTLLYSCGGYQERDNRIYQDVGCVDSITDPATRSIALLASWGFPEYLIKQLSTISSNTKVLLLFHFLFLAIGWSDIDECERQLINQNIAILLENSCNPNLEVQASQPYLERTDRQTAPPPQQQVSPWLYWISTDTVAHWASNITLLLLRAGASFHSNSKSTSKVLQEFRNRLQLRRDDVNEGEKSVIDEILKMMGSAPQKRGSKRDSNDSDHHIKVQRKKRKKIP